mgnify:CR=1 FL=1
MNLRVALAQINPTLGDLADNAATIESYLSQARRQETDIVVFPELSLCGYPPEDLLLKPRFLRDCRETLEEIADHCGHISALVGVPWQDEGVLYNGEAVLAEDRVLSVYSKRELPNYGVFDEKRYFQPGDECLLLRIQDSLVALTVCEDLWVEGGVVEQQLCDLQPDAVINISASPFYAGKLQRRRDLLARFARRCNSWLCYCNLVGGQDELVFDGGSMVMDPQGGVVASAHRFQESLLIADLDMQPRERPESRAPTIEIQTRATDREPVEPEIAEPCDEMEEIYDALVLGLSDYVSKNGFEKVVLGLSGGIDSSLGAAIAVEALGEENVVGVTMPSRYTSRGTFSDAGKLAANLGIRLVTVPIRQIFAVYADELEDALDGEEGGVAYENLQARIRGNILMTLSNQFGWLVLATGNKSELAVGYCTLYGDMCGGFAVIKDVPKTTVYKLTRYFNEKCSRELIPQSVLDRAPSAELKEDQKDEDALPRYEILDPILTAYVEEDKMPPEISAEGCEFDVVREVVRMVDKNEYKRRQAPPGIKITPKAFGKDRRLPITNKYSSDGTNK